MGSTAQDLNNRSSKRSRRGNRHPSVVDWNSIQSDILREAIRLVSRSGGALRFGYTRDQGAYAIGIYGEGDPYTDYFHSPEDCADYLRELIRDYGSDDENALKLGV